jgi:ParB-like chromosome segregation protein Spo0J
MTVVPMRPAENVMTLEIARIRRDPRTQPRNHINLEVAGEYREAMERGDAFPPVTCFFDGSDYWLADGWHRVTASLSLKLPNVLAEVRPGTVRDAILHSVGANATHGYPRTNKDKQRAVFTLLNDEEWSQWTDSEIARRCHVHQTTVMRHRAEMSPMQSISERRYRTKHGTEATMNTAGIGKRPNGTAFHDGTGWHEIADPQAERRAAEDEEKWRQTHIEEFCGPSPYQKPAAPADPKFSFLTFPPEHAHRATRIRKLVRDLYQELTLTPAEAVSAFPWPGQLEYLVEAGAVSDWLAEVVEILSPKDTLLQDKLT